MTTIRRTAVGSALATAALSILLLTGCSGGGGDDASDSGSSSDSSPSPSAEAQSTEDACAVANAEVQGLTTALQEAQSKAATDPASVAPALRDIEATLDDTNADITNDEVNAAVARAADSLEGLAVQVDKAIADPQSVSVDEATAASTEVQDAFTAVGELCS